MEKGIMRKLYKHTVFIYYFLHFQLFAAGVDVCVFMTII